MGPQLLISSSHFNLLRSNFINDDEVKKREASLSEYRRCHKNRNHLFQLATRVVLFLDDLENFLKSMSEILF